VRPFLGCTGPLPTGRALCYTICMDLERWHILRVHSGHEDTTAKACGVLSYVPRRVVRSYNRRMRVWTSRVQVMLPGFVFVRTLSPRGLRIPPSGARIGFMRDGTGSYLTLDPRSFGRLLGLEQEFRNEADEELSRAWDMARKAIADTSPEVGENVDLPMGLRAVVKEIRGDRLLAEIVGTSMRVNVGISDVARVA